MDRLVATGQREIGWYQVFMSPGSRTNLIQPFWALPAPAIAVLKAKDVMGFCLIVLIVSGVVISAGLLWARKGGRTWFEFRSGRAGKVTGSGLEAGPGTQPVFGIPARLDPRQGKLLPIRHDADEFTGS
jgi:Short chain fatty acid transporter